MPGPYTFVAADALTMKVREDGRAVNAVVLVATGVNADGHREVLGVQVTTSETGPAWLTFLQELLARGLGGVRPQTPPLALEVAPIGADRARGASTPEQARAA
jgi:transposase-like protein